LGGAEGTYGQLLCELSHLERALGQSELEELGPEQLVGRLRVFINDRETLYKLPELYRLTAALQGAGLLGLLAELKGRNLTVDQSVACLRFVWQSSILDAVSLADPEVGTFDGPAYTRTVDEFRGADTRHISTTPVRTRRAVAENVIATRDAYPTESQLVTHEAGKKRRHVPVRLLFQQAPHVLTALKPCWAMSPLVVSQVLPVERCFDVVIFDEASQVTPESAVGALMRAGQAVVAGDPHQLPPTAFFASGSATDDDEDDEDEELAATSMSKDFESVLDVMGALLPPPIGTKRLNWHYRSRDERLIAFSNAQPQLYDWSLTTFPGAQTGDVITHQLVPFTPGQVDQEQSMAAEVAAVVQAVTAHAHDRPGESLGVITMGIKHMERINEALRRARQEDPDLDDYLNEVFYDTEKFFVKNLERVQGDERDAILISVGYGKNAEGRMLYRFGPLNQKGGERRLNVAITRARSRIGVISSFSSVDLDPARLKADGAQMLRDYLLYTESGGTDLGERRRERDPLNHFEQDVLTQLTAAGLNLESQVGCSGYWIDFAAKHPTEPGRYVLAIEADGVMYHSSATARDRDRLRQDHLERLGWTFHRIWSTDWFRHREREVARAVAAFEDALREDAEPEPIVEPMIESLVEPEVVTVHIHERTSFKPVEPDRGPITEYRHSELVALVRWINSDGRLRTKGELVEAATRELGFKRKASRIVVALEAAVDEGVAGTGPAGRPEPSGRGTSVPQTPPASVTPPWGYEKALDSGATHLQSVAIANAGGGLDDLAKAMDAGATAAEALEVVEAGAPLGAYAGCRTKGATHPQTMDVINAKDDLRDLATVLELGVTAPQALEMLALDTTLFHYSLALKAGATHHQCVDIIAAGSDPSSFAGVLERGATFDEAMGVLGVLATETSLLWYSLALKNGATYAQTMAVLDAGVELGQYVQALEKGSTHDEVMVSIRNPF
jgi:very-short-patch-repair endonuclease